MSRRGFLRGIGAAAAASAVTVGPGLAGTAAVAADTTSGAATPTPLTFGRMFDGLPPFAAPGPALTAALLDIGKPGGLLDAKDNLAAGPVALILDPALRVNNPDNPGNSAGTTFMGQFYDHDITFDVGSPLGVPAEPTRSTNGRTPRLDMDTVYGLGPVGSPHLYNPSDRAKLNIESGGRFEDLPRAANSQAIIGDPRNDENLIIAGIQCAMIKFHNRVVDLVRANTAGLLGPKRGTDFERARRLVTWHYQWLLVHSFLPEFVGQAKVDQILKKGRRFYLPGRSGPYMPVEFQTAAYRFGHSLVRPSYRANMKGNPGDQPFFGFIFDPAAANQADPDDLVGGVRSPRRFIGWQTFFDFGDGQVKNNKRIDTKLSTPLFNLPLSAIASRDQPQVLPQRTLLRHVTWSLPSGQRVAQRMGVAPLAVGDFKELAPYGLNLRSSTPLFYYILKEAELTQSGLNLGEVGGQIVAEVFLGLLQLDPQSYLATNPNWQPTLPARQGSVTGDFTMVDLLTLAGVDPTSRGQ